MYKSRFTHQLTKVLVDIMFYGGMLCCVAVPFVMTSGFFRYEEEVILPLTIIFELSGLLGVYILWQLKAMFRTILQGDPFVAVNIVCLRKCAAASLLLTLIHVVKCVFFWFTIMSAPIVIIFGLLGLFCLTLKDVFKQALVYKEENDWTV